MKTIKISSKKVQLALEKLTEACKPNQSERNGLPIGYRVPLEKILAKLSVYMNLRLLNEEEYEFYYWKIIETYRSYPNVTQNTEILREPATVNGLQKEVQTYPIA